MDLNAIDKRAEAALELARKAARVVILHDDGDDVRRYEADFIAAARTEVPGLATDVRALVREVQRLRDLVRGIGSGMMSANGAVLEGFHGLATQKLNSLIMMALEAED